MSEESGYYGEIPYTKYMHEMEVGEVAYATPWAFEVDEEKREFFHLYAEVKPRMNLATGYCLEITRTGLGVGQFLARIIDDSTISPSSLDAIVDHFEQGFGVVRAGLAITWEELQNYPNPLMLDEDLCVKYEIEHQSWGEIVQNLERAEQEEERVLGNQLVQSIKEYRDNKFHYPCDPKRFPTTHEDREMLNLAIDAEDFEYAAEIRDKINKTTEPLK